MKIPQHNKPCFHPAASTQKHLFCLSTSTPLSPAVFTPPHTSPSRVFTNPYEKLLLPIDAVSHNRIILQPRAAQFVNLLTKHVLFSLGNSRGRHATAADVHVPVRALALAVQGGLPNVAASRRRERTRGEARHVRGDDRYR